jgi:NAD(P)-dependent dehydrogenase (short-subunit alcohol dehydrogenase family)
LVVSISIQDAAPHLWKGSSVIIISSIAGYNPEPALSMYGVTKTALFGLIKVYFHLLSFSLTSFTWYLTFSLLI